MFLIKYWQTRLNLFAKLLSGFVAIVSLALLMGGLTLYQIQILSNNLEQVERQRILANAANDLRLATTSQVLNTLDRLWNGRPGGRQEDFAAQIQESFRQLRAANLAPDMLTKLNKLNSQTEELTKVLNQTIELETTGKSIEARVNWVTVSVVFQDFNQAITEFWQIQELALQQATRQASDARNNAIFIILGCAALTVLLMIILVLLVPRSIVKRVRAVSLAMQQIADNTSLNMSQLAVVGSDELAQMAHSFNQMIAKLSAATLALQTTGQTVSSSSNHFSSMMQRQLVMAEQEASAVNAIVSSATELRQTAHHIDERVIRMAGHAEANFSNIKLLSGAVGLTTEQVTKTHQATQTVTAGITRMLSETHQVTEEVQSLVEQLSSIQRLADGLKNIAEETHLLSLNAAIECAGAGMYGERFGVVAAAIKHLAGQSNNLVTNMSYFVGQIGLKVQNVNSAIAQTDQELAHSQQLVTLIERIGEENSDLATQMFEAVQKISSMVEETVQQTQNIVQVTREQRLAIDEIINTINMVEVSVNDNMEHYHISVEAVSTLQTEVNRLNSLVNRLNLPMEKSASAPSVSLAA